MAHLLPSESPSCARCGMHVYQWRSPGALRYIHPFQTTRVHCVDVGKVYRSDLTFAGWWADRDFIKRKFGEWA